MTTEGDALITTETCHAVLLAFLSSKDVLPAFRFLSMGPEVEPLTDGARARLRSRGSLTTYVMSRQLVLSGLNMFLVKTRVATFGAAVLVRGLGNGGSLHVSFRLNHSSVFIPAGLSNVFLHVMEK